MLLVHHQTDHEEAGAGEPRGLTDEYDDGKIIWNQSVVSADMTTEGEHYRFKVESGWGRSRYRFHFAGLK